MASWFVVLTGVLLHVFIEVRKLVRYLAHLPITECVAWPVDQALDDRHLIHINEVTLFSEANLIQVGLEESVIENHSRSVPERNSGDCAEDQEQILCDVFKTLTVNIDVLLRLSQELNDLCVIVPVTGEGLKVHKDVKQSSLSSVWITCCGHRALELVVDLTEVRVLLCEERDRVRAVWGARAGRLLLVRVERALESGRGVAALHPGIHDAGVNLWVSLTRLCLVVVGVLEDGPVLLLLLLELLHCLVTGLFELLLILKVNFALHFNPFIVFIW